MKNSSQVIGLPLISISEGAECGIIKDIMIEPQKKKIKSLIIRGSKNEYDFCEIKLGDITGIGKDYVTTQCAENKKSIETSNPGISLLGLTCIASSGDVLGSIKEYAFDEKTGDISSIQIDSGLEASGKSILSISDKLIFVDREDKPKTVEKKEEIIGYNVKKEEAEADDRKKPSSPLAKEQKDYLFGRTVKNDIKNTDGTVIIKKGTVVTADTIYLAKNKDLLIDLTLEVE